MPPDPTLTTVPLPPTIARALTQIAAELADMPRECARDFQELCLWKGRMARRIRGVLTMRVPVGQQAPRIAAPGPVSAWVAAEAVFGAPNQPTGRKQGARTIKDRRGRVVRVETRQMELSV